MENISIFEWKMKLGRPQERCQYRFEFLCFLIWTFCDPGMSLEPFGFLEMENGCHTLAHQICKLSWKVSFLPALGMRYCLYTPMQSFTSFERARQKQATIAKESTVQSILACSINNIQLDGAPFSEEARLWETSARCLHIQLLCAWQNSSGHWPKSNWSALN